MDLLVIMLPTGGPGHTGHRVRGVQRRARCVQNDSRPCRRHMALTPAPSAAPNWDAVSRACSLAGSSAWPTTPPSRAVSWGVGPKHCLLPRRTSHDLDASDSEVGSCSRGRGSHAESAGGIRAPIRRQVSRRDSRATRKSPNSGITVSSTVRPSDGIGPRACFAKVAGVAEVLAGGPTGGDLQAHLAVCRSGHRGVRRVGVGASADKWP